MWRRAEIWLTKSGVCIAQIYEPMLSTDEDGWVRIEGKDPNLTDGRSIQFNPDDGLCVVYVQGET